MSSKIEGIMEEDEDVILQGSELHTILTRMGYSDFESVAVCRIENINSEVTVEYLCNKVVNLPINQKLSSVYNSILYSAQDKQFLDEQLRIILRLDCILDDHASKIQSFIGERKQNFWKKTMYWLPLLSSSLITVFCGFTKKYKNILNTVLVSTILGITTHRRFLQWKASKNLKRLIFLQNEFYHSCRKSLNILRYSFRMKLDSRKSGQKFIELEKSKQMYLPPLTEIIISSLENVSLVYYQTSNSILKLLPTSLSTEDLITVFEKDSFCVRGEITYQTLKNLYYTYLLVQSEMLYILAIAYNRDTWLNFGGCPELKLAYIISNLTRSLEIPCFKLLKLLNEYSTKKFVPQHREYKGSKTSKWQDLYVHLDLTAYKLQTAYKVILSTLEEIDSHSDMNSIEDISEVIMQNLNEVYKQIDAARNFTEFSSLLVAKVQNEQSKKEHFKEKDFITESLKSELPIVLDSEPQIVDEVFEEYIKEEYIKPLYEDGDESVLQNYKFDKLLAKNFMSELKDALLEKHKSMSERELKALQRMYKKVTQEIFSKQGDNSNEKLEMIPPPPPLPSDIFTPKDDNEMKMTGLSISNFSKSKEKIEKIDTIHENELEKMEDLPEQNSILKRLSVPVFYGNEEQIDAVEIDVQRFSIVESKPRFSLFLKKQEETFIGSGENSDDELTLNDVEDET